MKVMKNQKKSSEMLGNLVKVTEETTTDRKEPPIVAIKGQNRLSFSFKVVEEVFIAIP